MRMIPSPFKQPAWKRLARSDERGQALIELAVSATILITLLLGAAEFARFAYLAIEMSNSAKSAAQYGAQNSLTANDQTGMKAIAKMDAPEANSACTNFTTTITETCTCGTSSSATATTCGSSCATGYAINYLTIQTSAKCTPLIYPKNHGATLTLTGNAVQEILR